VTLSLRYYFRLTFSIHPLISFKCVPLGIREICCFAIITFTNIFCQGCKSNGKRCFLTSMFLKIITLVFLYVLTRVFLVEKYLPPYLLKIRYDFVVKLTLIVYKRFDNYSLCLFVRFNYVTTIQLYKYKQLREVVIISHNKYMRGAKHSLQLSVTLNYYTG